MSFEFFNTSALAFGSKLTAAFKQLESSSIYAIDNLDRVLSDLDYYQQYIDKNYRVPVPTREGMAVRVNEIYAVVDEIAEIKKMEYSNNLLSVEVTFFNKTTNRITNAIGSTELKEGYAYVIPAPSNDRLTRNIRFSSTNDQKASEILLFAFRVDNRGRIFLKGNLTNPLKLYPQDATQYTSLSKGSNLTFPHTATEDECICVVGKRNNFDVKVNGTSVIYGVGGGAYDNINHTILYLKKGDRVSGTIDFGFKINYNY